MIDQPCRFKFCPDCGAPIEHPFGKQDHSARVARLAAYFYGDQHPSNMAIIESVAKGETHRGD